MQQRKKWIGLAIFLSCLALRLLLSDYMIVAPHKSYIPPKPQQRHGLEAVNYQHLPGWQTSDLNAALRAFQVSCRWVIKKQPEANVGNHVIPLKARDWQTVCQEALHLDDRSAEQIKQFFEGNFIPVKWSGSKAGPGTFTGYYSPLYAGSLHRDKTYQVPVYGVPADLVTAQLRHFDPHLPSRQLIGRVNQRHVIPYYTRREINHGAIKHHAPVLVWLENEADRLFLEIQGAGIIKLENGKKVPLGYAGENGAPYRSVAQVLINRGVMTKDNASMPRIRRYIKEHPKEGQSAMNVNASFVFFDLLPKTYAPGTQGIPLTPGHSMAVDRKWVPLGVPVWLKTRRPDASHPDQSVPFQRLMIAQDTGGAIRGKVRGDVYWGSGKQAARIAGNMKYQGMYWMLLPKNWVLKHVI